MRLNLPMLLAAIALFAVEAVWAVKATRLAIGVFLFACAVELAQWFRLADVLHLTGWVRVVLGDEFQL